MDVGNDRGPQDWPMVDGGMSREGTAFTAMPAVQRGRGVDTGGRSRAQQMRSRDGRSVAVSSVA